MLREFFLKFSFKGLIAWAGLFVFVGHQLFRAYIKWRLNLWYETFYNVLEEAGGDLGSGETYATENGRSKINAQLVDFVRIVAPSIIVHPVAGLIKNWWVLEWRMALIKSYIRSWDTGVSAIEGASQRVHEDTQRFASGIHSCVAVILDSVLTLLVFCPVLYDLMPSLMAAAIIFAGGGLLVSALLGYHLVKLEVNNQQVEAAVRKDLVLLECKPETLGNEESVASKFAAHVRALKHNYKRLYLNFACLATWLAAYEQAAVLVPYTVAAPLLFAASSEKRISLGTLVKMSNAFGKVFDSFNIVADNWMQVNEWRSTLRRLKQFEDSIYNQQVRARIGVHQVPSSVELAEVPETELKHV